jgi:hypothetical protein
MDTLLHRPQPTILDCLEGGVVNTCPECGNPVVVRRLPRTGELDTWADHSKVLFTRCHTCVLGAAPEEHRATLEARFNHILHVRDSLGRLLRWVLDSAGTPRPMPATLTQRTWYPVNRDGPDDPYLEEFVVTGSLPDTFDSDIARRELASSPVYRVFRDEEGVGATVYLVIHARLPAVPDAYLEWRYDQYNPAWSWEPMIRGFGRASAKDISHLTFDGRRLFAINRAMRGPQIGKHKRYPEGEEGIFLEDVKRVLRTHEEDGWRLTSVESFADFMEMSKPTLYKYFDRVPEAEALVRRHIQSPPRR